MPTATRAALIASPYSGAGKTVCTLALLSGLRQKGLRVAGAKLGPDYIDPAFHESTTGHPALALDLWAMHKERLLMLWSLLTQEKDCVLVEGAMGLFDGAVGGGGSSADLADFLRLPVLLVVPCAKMGQSVAALVQGFVQYRPSLSVTGLLLNQIGSARHERLLRNALAPLEIPILGAVPSLPCFALEQRHLGLIQAQEISELRDKIETAGQIIFTYVDRTALLRSTVSVDAERSEIPERSLPGLPPLGRHIALARDAAFGFLYPHFLKKWQAEGVQLSFFSPLRNEAPNPSCDAVFLPGGYPELHAARLSQAQNFRKTMQDYAARGVLIYGECGGYMSLGESLIDAQGTAHPMLGLLPLVTSFATRKRQLGYRLLRPYESLPPPFARMGKEIRGHEFHYATTLKEGSTETHPLFHATDSEGIPLPPLGLRRGSVMGSFAHVIDGGD